MATKCTVPGGETIVKGDAVCIAGFDTAQRRPIVKRATRNNLATSKTVFGVTEDDAAGGSVSVLVAGDVAENAVAAGDSRIIVTDLMNAIDTNQCKLRRINTDSNTVPPRVYVVGTCDENGHVAIQPRHSSWETHQLCSAGFPLVFNVRAYGAVPDWSYGRTGRIDVGETVLTVNNAADLRVGQKLLIGKNQDTYEIAKISDKTIILLDPKGVFVGATDERVVVDNLPYFHAALAAMRAFTSTGYHNKSACLVADGHFYLHGTLEIFQTVHFHGSGFGEPESPSVDEGLRSSPGTWLVFPPNTTGIRIHSTAPTDDKPTEGSGERTSLHDMTISCVGPLSDITHGNTTGSGVHATINCSMQNLNIQGFAEHGVLLVGNSDETATNGNTDTSFLQNVVTGSCGLDGFHAVGADANTSTFLNCSAYGNGRFGFSDATAMNTYVMCSGHGNSAGRAWGEVKNDKVVNVTGTIGEEEYVLTVNTAWGIEVGDYLVVFGMGEGGEAAYPRVTEVNGNKITLHISAVNAVTDAEVRVGCNYRTKTPLISTSLLLNSSSFLGCYSEDGPPDQFYGIPTIVGGLMHTTDDSSAFILDHGVAKRAPLVYQNHRGKKTFRISFGDGGETIQGPGTEMIALNWSTLDAAGIPDDSTFLRYMDVPPPLPGQEEALVPRGRYWWALVNNDVAFYSRHTIRFPTIQANVRQPAPWFVNGIFLGRDDVVTDSPTIPRVHFIAAPEIPEAQYSSIPFDPLTYEQGDVVWNSEPSAGGPLGWVCIRGGTQGKLVDIKTAGPGHKNDATVTLTLNKMSELLAEQYIMRLAVGQYIRIGTDRYRIVKIILPTIDIAPGAVKDLPVGADITVMSGTPPKYIQTARPVKKHHTTLTLNEVDGLVPGQDIRIGSETDVYTIVKMTLPTIDIVPIDIALEALVNPPIGEVTFSNSNFSTFGEVTNLGQSTSYAVNKVLELADRYVTVTAAGAPGTKTMTLPSSPVDGQTHSIKCRDSVPTMVNAAGGIPIDGDASVDLAQGENGTFRYSAATGEWERR